MNALRRYIQRELDARGWRPHDLATRSGLSRQQISKLLNDDRELLPQLPRTSTLEALAKAFNVTAGHVTTVAVEALGVPGVLAPSVVHEIETAADETLLRELLRRAVARGEDVPEPVPMMDRRSLAQLRAELQAALAALADFDALTVSGPAAEAKRAELQAHADAIAELVASRTAPGEPQNVAESLHADM